MKITVQHFAIWDNSTLLSYMYFTKYVKRVLILTFFFWSYSTHNLKDFFFPGIAVSYIFFTADNLLYFKYIYHIQQSDYFLSFVTLA